MTKPLFTPRQPGRRTNRRQWSRLERNLTGSALPALVVGLQDQPAAVDTAEMRQYLAAQTSQVV
jgi:hypothetical protein